MTRELLERELKTPARMRPGRSAARAPAPSEDDVAPLEQRGGYALAPTPDVVRGRRADRRRVAGERAIGAERELIRVLLHRAEYFDQVIERLGADSFRDSDLRRIFAALLAYGADAGPAVLAEHLDGDTVLVMQDMLEETEGFDHVETTVSSSLSAIHERDLTERMSEIDRLLPISNSEEKDGLLMEKTRLRDQLATLGGRWWKNFR